MHDNLLPRSLSLGVKEMNAAPTHSKRIKELVCACSSKVQHLRPFVTEYFLLERKRISCRVVEGTYSRHTLGILLSVKWWLLRNRGGGRRRRVGLFSLVLSRRRKRTAVLEK